MRRFGRTLRARPALSYALVGALVLPLVLAVVSGASSSAQTAVVNFLVIGASVLIRAYRAGDDQ